MRFDWYTKFVLTVIVLALVAIAMRPTVVHAQISGAA